MRKIKTLRVGLSVLCCLNFFVLNAQFKLDLIPIDQSQQWLSETINLEESNRYANQFAVNQALQKVLVQLHGQSYLAASVDSLITQDSVITAFLNIGNAYKWATLSNKNVDERFLNQTGFKEKLYTNKPFNFNEVEQLMSQLLTYAENNGYPFASVFLDDIVVDSQFVSASINMNVHQLITINEINIEGDADISLQYLSNYLGIKKGDLYNEAKILNIKNRIRELPFLSEKRNVGIIFSGNQANLTLFLNDKKASRFDFILGFLPKSDLTGRLTLNGSLQAELHNPFGTGKIIGIDWQQLRAETSRLDAKFFYPYVGQLPFGLDTKLHIFRRDTSFRDINTDLGIQYQLEGNNYLKGYVRNTSSSLLSINANQIIQTRRLPSILDVSNTIFGVEWNFEQLDYRYNPRKGFSFKINSGAGVKRIPKNIQITELQDENEPDFNFESLYDDINEQTFQFRGESTIAYYQGFGARNVMKLGVQSGFIFSQDSIYQNELYRIGGNRILRGFDEESILSTFYAITTIEYRFILSTNSFLYGFSDIGYVQDNSVGSSLTDLPIGLGVGMSFETSAGIIGISAAVGRQQNGIFDFRSSKIHFGYLNFF